MCSPSDHPPYEPAVVTRFQRTAIAALSPGAPSARAAVRGRCRRCDVDADLVAGYYVGGGRGDGVPWWPVCSSCDVAILEDPADPFANGHAPAAAR
jgi:hypothetical protein